MSIREIRRSKKKKLQKYTNNHKRQRENMDMNENDNTFHREPK